MTEQEARELLEGIAAADWAVPAGARPAQVITDVTPFLASTDPHLRDDLVLAALGTWVYERDLLDDRELGELLDHVLEGGLLTRGIGAKRSDTVFGRTFAMLAIGLVLLCDNRRPFLTEESWCGVVGRLVDYCHRERDFRGFVPGKGAAHAPAHAADALDEVVRGRYASSQNCTIVLDCVASLVTRCDHVFDRDEDLRLAVPLAAMINAGKVPATAVCECMEAHLPAADDFSPAQAVVRSNWRQVLRSLYFQLLHEEGDGCAALPELADADVRLGRSTIR
jgi:hypothetical protein